MRNSLKIGHLPLLLALGMGNVVFAANEDLAKSLEGLRVEVPCSNPKFNEDTECYWDQSLALPNDPTWKLKREVVRKFAGHPEKLYSVTLRVRGVVEPKNFTGGKVLFDHFQIGGEPVKNDYNFYTLRISNPQETYNLNRNEEKVGHYTFPIDYTVTLPIRGGASVMLGAYDSNTVAIANHKKFVVADIAPAPAFYDGQFVQLDLLKVEEIKE
jgi:hypothetical protein